MSYAVERLSILFSCTHCCANQMFTGDSLPHVLDIAKKAGWTFPWKIENISPTIYESAEECVCPVCDNRKKVGNTVKAADRYIVYYPPGSTILDGKSIDNSELASQVLEMLRSKGDIYINIANFSNWKILHQINDKWLELIPRTSFTEKEIKNG